MPGTSFCQQQLNWKRHKRVILSLGILGAWILLAETCADRQIAINTSPSVPPGIYLRSRSEPKVGNIVDFCIPAPGLAYVAGRSAYSGQNWYILKMIAAGPGDQVDATGDWLEINGKRVAPIFAQDADGRQLPRWREARVLGADEFFVFSDRIPNSFDSRYYGPIQREQIKAVRVSLVTW